MGLIIFGEVEFWDRAKKLLGEYGTDIQIIGYCALNLENRKDLEDVYTLREVLTLYEKHQIDGVINIQGENPYYFELLEKIGIKDIYVLPDTLYKRAELAQLKCGEKLVYRYQEVKPELMQIEFHLADHCNLNCKGCTHYSNLVKEPVFPDFEQFQKDVYRLAELFSNIHNFYFLGGEPLLNPEVEKYVNLVAKVFPYTNIIVVSNGIRVLLMSEKLISTLKEHKVRISISNYDCLNEAQITDFIRKNGLDAELRTGKGVFSKFLNPKGDSDKKEIFEQCVRKNCTFLGKGKIAACCQPFLVHYFNEYFGENIPENEAIDIYKDGLDGWEVQKYLTTPMDICRYCTYDEFFEWERSKEPHEKDEWEVKTKDDRKGWVSIILPTYNRAGKITTSIESVLSQTYKQFELLIIDDGSTDGTEEVVRKIKDDRIRYIKLEQNRGQAAARNYGIKNAKFDYIAFQDSDDKWHPQKLELQMKALEDASLNVGMVYHKMRYQLEGIGSIIKPNEDISLERKNGDIYKELLWDNLIGMPTLLVKRECLEQVGGFDETMKSLEDYDLVLRIAQNYEAVFVDEILLEAAFTEGSVSTNSGQYILASCVLVQKYKKDYLATNTLNHRLEKILEGAAQIGIQEEVVKLLEKIMML